MKQAFWKLTTIVLAVLLLAAIYLLSPLSERTKPLKIVLEREGKGGYRAIVVNSGYLPVFVGRCERVSDVMDRDVKVGDAIQRWQLAGSYWETPYYRNHCTVVPLGIIEAKFRRKLLWPRQRLHTSPFFPNVGFPGSSLQHGDRIRFLLFTRAPEQTSEALVGPEFTVE